MSNVMHVYHLKGVHIDSFHFLISFMFQITMVTSNKTGRPRGYSFIEYEHERDMRCKADKQYNGRDGLLVFVHVMILFTTC